MKWGLWSTTAASNSATPPDGWPEGQLPSTVNDCAREMMAQIRTGLNNIQFIDLGVTPVQTGNTTFTLAGNQMQWYQYATRVQANVGGTLYYGTVTSASFTTNTGVTLRFDPASIRRHAQTFSRRRCREAYRSFFIEYLGEMS